MYCVVSADGVALCSWGPTPVVGQMYDGRGEGVWKRWVGGERIMKERVAVWARRVQGEGEVLAI